MRPLLPSSLPVRLLLALGAPTLALVVTVGILLEVGGPTRPAHADVVRAVGFEATVLGWSSWYGSYDLAGLGQAWCIDHGSHAPDAELGYVPTDVTDAAPDTRAAMAWALAHPPSDAIDAASIMLVLHDLMGAQYPSGRLDVHQMGAGDLAGFGGHEGTVLDRARHLKDDALAHAHLRGPLHLVADAPPVAAGQTSELVVRLTDANGAPVDRATVHVHAVGAALLAEGHAPTAADGVARFPYRAANGANRFQAVAVAADPSLHAWGPTAAPAQRVARPSTVEVVARTGFEVLPPDGSIELDKTDAATGEPLPGAVFDLAFDADADGSFETPAGQVTSEGRPVSVPGLTPGNYRLTETSAPPGYAPLADPFVVTVPPGQVADVEVANTPRASVAFQKVATGEVDPAQVTLAGAVFVVTGPHDRPPEPPVIGDEGDDSGEDLRVGPGDEVAPSAPVASATVPEVGRCTTDDSGRCALPADVLLSGRRYCAREVVAPPGFGPAVPGCFRAGRAATVRTVEVDEPSTFTDVVGTKLDAVTHRPVADAVYDLYRVAGTDDGTTGPAPPVPGPPADADLVDDHTWVGRAESDADGVLMWPPQIPGHRYCAREHKAPAGYARNPDLVCTEVLVAGQAARLTVVDRPVGPPATVPDAPPPDRPPTSGPNPAPPRSPAPDRPTHQSALPVAGVDAIPVTSIAVGLILLGVSFTSSSRRRRNPR